MRDMNLLLSTRVELEPSTFLPRPVAVVSHQLIERIFFRRHAYDDFEIPFVKQSLKVGFQN